MDDAIRKLLDVLVAAEDAGIPLTDTDVRERLFEVVDRGFIHEQAGYQVPAGLLDDCGDNDEQKARVREALASFLALARQYAARVGMNTPDQRQTAFMESDVTSSSSVTDVHEYFY